MFSVDHMNQIFAVKLFAISPALVLNLTPTTYIQYCFKTLRFSEHFFQLVKGYF